MHARYAGAKLATMREPCSASLRGQPRATLDGSDAPRLPRMDTSPSYQLLDADKARSDAAQDTSAREQGERHAGRAILCAACGAQVSDASQRIEVAGRHQHTFFNPEGIVFQILCFATAPGCRGVGPFSPEFTWFPGHRWQVAVCARCGEHLGWHFDGELAFTALIEPRILEAGD